jgi:formate-dependent phosphoribosylglycinamide formyltransferase (GAR transformylase)
MSVQRTINHKNRSGYRKKKRWNAVEGSRGDVVEVIVEAFVIQLITLLTVVQNNNPHFFVR